MTTEAPPLRIPQYSGACTANIVPSILGPGGCDALPPWMPEVARGARNVVVLVLDGLGWHQLNARRHLAPTLASMSGGSITTVAPTTTVTALTSIATGLTPGEHGMMGYRMDLGRRVVQMLRWADDRGDVRREFPPEMVQPCPPFMGAKVPVISRVELEGTAFTDAHLRGTTALGWKAASSIAVTIGEQLRSGARFVYAYYDGVDKIAHACGFGEYYDAELRQADRIVGDVCAQLGPDDVLLVTADHGQVSVGDDLAPPHADVLSNVAYQSGESRFRWLHAKSGRVDDVIAAARLHHGDIAHILTREEAIDRGLFGARVSDAARKRLGDVALIPTGPHSFEDPEENGPHALVCRHGALTDEELDVPLLALRGGN